MSLLNQVNIIIGHKDKHGVPMGIKKVGCDTGDVNFFPFLFFFATIFISI